MHRQIGLPLTRDAVLKTLWDKLPRLSRKQIIDLYARMIAYTAQAESGERSTEGNNEQTDN